MAAHRYWRINFTGSVGGASLTLFDVEFRTTFGGSDVTDGAGGTASASASSAGTGPANLFDSSPTNRWARSSTSAWIQYDFGAANTKDIIEFTMACGADVTQAPKDFTLQYSDDGTAFTTVGTFANIINWQPGQRRTFQLTGEVSTPAPPAATRYWRVVCKDLQGGAITLSVAEMELRESAGGSDVATTSTALDGSVFSAGQGAANCFDGNASTTWQVTSGNQPAWHYHDFGSGVTKSVMELGIMADASSGNGAPTAIYLQRSSDALGWTSVISLTGITGWVAGQTRYFQSTGEVSGLPPAAVRRVVFVCT